MDNMFTQAMQLLSKGVIVAGSLLTAWGLVTLGRSIKDSNGPGIGNAILEMVGGAMIIAAGAWFLTITF